MQPSALDQPVAAAMRSVEPLTTESSLERAATLLRGTAFDRIPVQGGSTIVGVVTEKTLGQALGRGCSPADSVEVALDRNFATISSHESGAEALRVMSDSGESTLLVVDPAGRMAGIVSASDLYPRRPVFPKPPLVGGMATPFGVYLTTGGLGAGVSRWALVSTGVLMFVLFAFGTVVELLLQQWASSAHLAIQFDSQAWDFLPLAILFIGMRLLPLSGIHAAEHKVVHAIERGEALVPEVVARMPRVHPRCGTNLFAGAMLFTLAVGLHIGNVPLEVRLVPAAIVTLFLWRPLGSALQWLLTTRPPSHKHIEMGIRSGKELLERYRVTRGGQPSIWSRIWHSGMIQVMVGFGICTILARGVEILFGLPVVF